MISIAKNGHRSAQSNAARLPAGLYLWVATAIFLFQLFMNISGVFKHLYYATDKLEGSLPSTYWWTTVDSRACAWLALVPLLAAIICYSKASKWQQGLLHMCLLVVALLVSGNFLHRFAHIQYDQLMHYVDANVPVASYATTNQSEFNSNALTPGPKELPEDYTQKSYEGVEFHKSYGAGYWLGEFMVVLTAYVMMCAVGYTVLFFCITEYRTLQAEQLRNIQVQLQHETLCNRLTPHFLFNTLNTISSLTLTDGKAARTCISQLGELLRDSIESLPEGEIRLSKEIEILQAYLTIQKTRFGDKLDYSIDVEEGLEAAMVPAFVLQPLVENSFQHGFQGQEDIAHIGISAKRVGNHCRLEVSDNGMKIDSAQPLDEKHGLGLTRQRLELQYAQDARIQYEPNQPRGLRVVVFVPLHEYNGKST